MARLGCVLMALVAAGWLALAQPPIAVAPAPKESIKETSKFSPGVKLPDGTYLWNGPTPTDSERVLLTPQEHQKLIDQIEQLKKQLAGRKGVPPSGCAIRAKIEKRGEAAVAALQIRYTFRTVTERTAVTLGAKRSFLVSAALDGNKLPVLETVEDGFAVLVEAAGEHTVILDVECPVSARGTKPEIGFDLGLPRSAITSLVFEPPPGVSRVSLVTRTSDPTQPAKPADVRRVSGLDVKALTAPAANRNPYPLGPIDSLELSWEPPSTTPAMSAIQSAEVDVIALLSEGFVESTARFRLRGTSRSWRIAAPVDAIISVDRVAGVLSLEPSSIESAVVTNPADATKPVWKIDLPPGSTAADWSVTAVVRTTRAKPNEPPHRGPFVVGPFAVLDVPQQSGMVTIKTGANTRLLCKHGPELRQEAPTPAPSEEESVSQFRLAAGPIGNLPPAAPLITVEAQPLPGKVIVRPNYKLTLTDAGWSVRAELRVAPLRTTVETVTIELPSEWRGPEVSPPELVEGALQLKSDGTRQVAAVRLAAEHKQPFDLVLSATIPLAMGTREASIPLPRFPGASERDATATVVVGDGFEVRGVGREWEGDQPASWTLPLPPATTPEGKPLKVVSTLTGKFDRGLARLDLSWMPYRPPLSADVRVEVHVHDSQLVVSERILLRSSSGFPRTVRFHGAPALKAISPLDAAGPGQWLYSPSAEAKEVALKFDFPVTLPAPIDGGVRKIPVALVLPSDASRVDTVVRVWVHSSVSRTVSAEGGAWRELAPEPVPEREAMPALTLAASGSDLQLTFTLRDAVDTAAASIWIERTLLQAAVGDDGIAYRARFRIRRWLSDSIDVHWPEALAEATPEAFLDEPAHPVPVALVPHGSGRLFRIALPEPKMGRSIILEIRYRLPNRPGELLNFVAPEPVAAYAGPVRWLATGPAGTVPLLISGGRSEQRWRLRQGFLAPLSISGPDLERWFQNGSTDDSAAAETEAVAVRLISPSAISVYSISRINLIIGCSLGVLVLGLMLSRLPGGLAGPLVAIAGGAVAVAAVCYPQPAAQAAAAAEPGLAGLILILSVQTFSRWRYRHRVTYLPGFTRTLPEASPSSTGGSKPSGRVVPSQNGSTGSVVAPIPTLSSRSST